MLFGNIFIQHAKSCVKLKFINKIDYSLGFLISKLCQAIFAAFFSDFFWSSTKYYQPSFFFFKEIWSHTECFIIFREKKKKEEFFSVFNSLWKMNPLLCLVNPCPAEPGYTLLSKQCRSRSVGFWTDLDLHCLSLSTWICMNNLDKVIWLAEN